MWHSLLNLFSTLLTGIVQLVLVAIALIVIALVLILVINTVKHSVLLWQKSSNAQRGNGLVILLVGSLSVLFFYTCQPSPHPSALPPDPVTPQPPPPPANYTCRLIDPPSANTINDQADFDLRFALADMTDGDNNVREAINHLEGERNLDPQDPRYSIVQNDLGCAHLKQALQSKTAGQQLSLSLIPAEDCPLAPSTTDVAQPPSKSAEAASHHPTQRQLADSHDLDQAQTALQHALEDPTNQANAKYRSIIQANLVEETAILKQEISSSIGCPLIVENPKPLPSITYYLQVAKLEGLTRDQEAIISLSINNVPQLQIVSRHLPQFPISLDARSSDIYCYKLQATLADQKNGSLTRSQPTFGPIYVTNGRQFVLSGIFNLSVLDRQTADPVNAPSLKIDPTPFLVIGKFMKDNLFATQQVHITFEDEANTQVNFTLDVQHPFTVTEVTIPSNKQLRYELEVTSYTHNQTPDVTDGEGSLDSVNGISYLLHTYYDNIRFIHEAELKPYNICDQVTEPSQ